MPGELPADGTPGLNMRVLEQIGFLQEHAEQSATRLGSLEVTVRADHASSAEMHSVVDACR